MLASQLRAQPANKRYVAEYAGMRAHSATLVVECCKISALLIKKERMMTKTLKLSTIGRLILALGLLAAGLAYAGASPAVAQDTVLPAAPTNVNVTVGDTEATITWQAGTVVSNCQVGLYAVRVYSDTEDVAISALLESTVTSWTLEGLTASTEYGVAVFAESSYTTCTRPWSEGAYASFTTNAATASGDPAVGNNEPYRAPRKVRNLAQTHSGTTATITWDAPNTPRKRQCAHVEDYAVRVVNRTTGTEIKDDDNNDISVAYRGSDKTLSLTGLVAGNNYRAVVFANSGTCGWSAAKRINWNQ